MKTMKKQLTIIEITISIFILFILISFVIYYSLILRENSLKIKCMSMQSNIGKAILMYSSDNDQTIPPISSGRIIGRYDVGGKKWFDLIMPYMNNKIEKCPSISTKKNFVYNSGYCMNARLNSAILNTKNAGGFTGISDVVIRNQSETVLLSDCRPGIYAIFSPDYGVKTSELNGIFDKNMAEEIVKINPACYRHQNGAIYLFSDGHSKFLTLEDFKNHTKSGTRYTFFP